MSYIGNEPPDTGAYGVQSFDGGGTSFTLSKPSTTATVLLFIDGVRQTPVDAYSVSGVTLTTTGTTPAGTDNVTVQFLGDVVDFGEPSDDSVSTVKIQDDAVTAAKLANSINTEIAANTAKVTNATHTGDVTGATALTIANDAVDIAMLSATGTASATTFLRGDNAWAAPTSPGDLTPAFMVILEGDDTVSSGGVERINFNVEMYDTDSAYDNTTNYRFTVPSGEGGAYVFFFQTMISDADGGYDIDHLEPKMRVNGTDRWAYTEEMNSSLERKYFAVHGGPIILDLAAADYVDCACYVHTSNGGDLKFLGPGSFSGGTWYGRTYFWGHKLPGVS